MSSFHLTQSSATAVVAKYLWEDPGLVVERDLFARGQSGPPDSQNSFSPQHLLAPLGLSPSANGACPPGTGTG